jgi:hypothetical protein
MVIRQVSREARFRVVRFRVLAAPVVLLLNVSAIRGYCPMSVPAATPQQMAGTHDCCKTGLTGQRPGCCHADQAPGAAATLTGGGAVTLPAASISDMPTSNHAASVSAAATPSFSSHSPPPTVLRI